MFKYNETEGIKSEVIVKQEQVEENVLSAENCTLTFPQIIQWENAHEPDDAITNVINVDLQVKRECAADGVLKVDDGLAVETDSPFLISIIKKERADSNDVGHYSDQDEPTTASRYKCEPCNRLFLCMSDLAKHTKSHTVQNPYKCETCSRNFANNAGLTDHTTMHGETTNKCERCGKYFSPKSSLINHSSGYPGKKTLCQCQTCGKSFSHRGSLRNHAITHTCVNPYKCQTCGQNFVDKRSLLRHTRTHHTALPYKCEKCTRQFSHKHYLVAHTVTHTWDKPYKCEKCSWQFSRRYDLLRHTRNEHEDKEPTTDVIKTEVIVKEEQISPPDSNSTLNIVTDFLGTPSANIKQEIDVDIMTHNSATECQF